MQGAVSDKPVGIRHFSTSGISNACSSINKAAWRSSSSLKACAEKAQVPMASAITSWRPSAITISLDST